MNDRIPPLSKTVIEAMIRDNIPHCGELGVRLVDVGPGSMTMALDYQERFVGNPETGVLHGGIITTLVDTVSGMSVYAALGKLVAVATLDLRIDYLKPAMPHMPLIAHAECYKTTRQIAFTRCTAYHQADDPVATCVGTFMIGSSSKPPVQMPAQAGGAVE